MGLLSKKPALEPEPEASSGDKANANANNDGDGSTTTDTPPRPGTSGTENLLISNRRAATVRLAHHKRLEREYRTRKHARRARADWNDTKRQFAETGTHLKAGVRGVINVVRAVPYLVRERSEARKAQMERENKEKEARKRKKLEEKLKKAGESGTAVEPEGEEGKEEAEEA